MGDRDDPAEAAGRHTRQVRVGQVDCGHGVDHHFSVLAACVQVGDGTVGAGVSVVHQDMNPGGRGDRRNAADLIGQAEISRQGRDSNPVPGL
jgi:hypothetical protein